MWFLFIIIGVALFFFIRGNIRRGRIFAQAYCFLEFIDTGETLEEANRVAALACTSSSNIDLDRQLQIRAKNFIDHNFNGKQLPLIALARQKGFTG